MHDPGNQAANDDEDEELLNDDGAKVKKIAGRTRDPNTGDSTPSYFCSRSDFSNPEDAPLGRGGGERTVCGPTELGREILRCKSCERFQARFCERRRIASTKRAAVSAISALQQAGTETMITEEMVNTSPKQLVLVSSENPTLKQEDTEVSSI